MSSLRRLPPSVFARIESHVSTPRSSAIPITRPPLLGYPPSASRISEVTDDKGHRIVVRDELRPNEDLRTRMRTDVNEYSYLLSSVRTSLANHDNRTATTESLTYIASMLSLPSSSTSTFDHHENLTEMLNLYLAKTDYAPSLQRLLRKINNPSLLPHAFALNLARASLRHPLIYKEIFRRTFGLVNTTDRGRYPLLHRLIDSLLERNVPGTDLAEFYLTERKRVEKRKPGITRIWNLELWNRIMVRLDPPRALEWLGSFKEAVQSQYHDIDLKTASALTIHPIVNPYTTFMQAWFEKRLRDGFIQDRAIPLKVARDLIDLIGGESQLPVPFLNAWMNAERVTQNHDIVWAIWKLFHHDTQTSSPENPKSHVDVPTRARPTPSDTSWIIYLKTKRSTHIGQNPLAFRNDIRELLETMRISGIKTKVLNQILATLCHSSPPDLPLLLCILRLYDWDPQQMHGPAPNRRTIDVVAAGLVRLWYTTGRSFDQLFIPWMAQDVRAVTTLLERTKDSIFRREWELVTEALRQLIPPEQEDQFRTEDLTLPLGAHKAVDLAINPSTSPDNSAEVNSVESNNSPSGQLTPAHVLLRPLLALVSNAIRLILSKRIHSDAEINKAYDALLERVYEDVLPNRKAWLKVGDDWERILMEEPREDNPSGRSSLS